LKKEVNALEKVEELFPACYNIPHGLTVGRHPIAQKGMLKATYREKNADSRKDDFCR
jgi:hypothetical protein